MSQLLSRCNNPCICAFLISVAVGVYMAVVIIISVIFEDQLPMNIALFVMAVYISTCFVILLVGLLWALCEFFYGIYANRRRITPVPSMPSSYIMDLPDEVELHGQTTGKNYDKLENKETV